MTRLSTAAGASTTRSSGEAYRGTAQYPNGATLFHACPLTGKHAPASVLSRLLIAWLLFGALAVACYGADEQHVCGKGPVAITSVSFGACPDACSCSKLHVGGDLYSESCMCTSAACANKSRERWTDWPECGGMKVVE